MKKTPGVADNKSYKDMYHFNSSFYPDTGEEDPNLPYWFGLGTLLVA